MSQLALSHTPRCPFPVPTLQLAMHDAAFGRALEVDGRDTLLFGDPTRKTSCDVYCSEGGSTRELHQSDRAVVSG